MSRTGRPLALLGALALLASAFLPWVGSGRTGIDLGLLSFGDRLAHPTVGLVLVVLAAPPAVAALLGDHGWPRGLSGLGAGALIVVWLAEGPDGTLATGVVVAMVAASLLLLGAAVASPSGRDAARYPEDDDLGSPGSRAAAPGAGATGADPTTGGDPSDGDVPSGASGAGARLVPFAAGPTIEGWGPTRASCFEAVALTLTGSVADPTRHQADGQVAVHVREVDDATTLLALATQTVALLRRGRVPVGADLFDTADGALVGYLATATVAAIAGTHVAEPTGADVDPGDPWRARLTSR